MLTKVKNWLGRICKVNRAKKVNEAHSFHKANKVDKTKNAKTNRVKSNLEIKPVIVPRSKHNISRANISSNALKVLYRLKNAGYQGYLVGGGVRDLLLDLQPKDFDIAADALPEEIRKLFRNCRLIGRRFRLAHIFFGNDIIEVATFRTTHDSSGQNTKGMLVRDNVYGNIDQDVLRRDFTINAIYYNIQNFSLVDYVGGIEDIKERRLRVIGDPAERYCEDPVRMLRAIRFASKLGLKLHKDTAAPLSRLAGLLKDVAPARLFDEYLKLFLMSNVQDTFAKLVQYGLYAAMFPQVMPHLESPASLQFIKEALVDTDKRIAAKKSVSPVFLLAVFLWQPFLEHIKLSKCKDVPFTKIQQDAIAHVFMVQRKTVMIPKNFVYVIQDIWFLQSRLLRLSAGNVVRCYTSSEFRMAYDFLLLRARAGDKAVEQVAKWWQDYVEGNDKNRRMKLKEL